MEQIASVKRGTILGRVKMEHNPFDSSIKMDAVAVAGAVGDWAAYANYYDQSDEEIYHRGYKLTEREAAKLFPHLNREAYRR